MKIISSFRDFYDTVSHQYLDKDIIYLRDQRTIEVSKKQKENFPEVASFGSHYEIKNLKNQYVTVEMFYIGFCGTIYPAVRFHSSSEDRTFFNFTTLKEYVDSNVYGIKDGKKYRFRWRHINCQYFSDYEDFFNDKEKIKNLEIKFYEFNTPCFVYLHSTNRETQFLINPILKGYSFATIKDPFSAHQEIYQFISGFLKQPVNPMVEISDKDKVHKHGFDKWSFRQKGPKK